MKASIALQVLPLTQGIDRIAVIDQVIAYLQAQEVTMVVTPFETVLEGGEFDELMRILKEALEVAGQEADNVFANVKINVGEILSIDEKLEKYTETTH
ncbi:thiamine-binding protein [Streptococcus mitis]|uniref:thiamine-binding protein n=1 Tax=Streptococcus mitis TaxID=28037 RepID=UPI0021B54524|nr:thiamine-binding protein [Streptococcus mitis]